MLKTINCLMVLFLISGCEKGPENITITIDLEHSIIKTNEPDYYFYQMNTRCKPCKKDYDFEGGKKMSNISAFDSTGCSLRELLKKGNTIIISAQTKPFALSKERPELIYWKELTSIDAHKSFIICRPNHKSFLGL
jgi:hypothetical protein